MTTNIQIKGQPMKNTVILFLSFLAGGAAVLLSGMLLFPLWFDLGWRKPIADWLVGLGHQRLAAYWNLVWFNLPEWCVAFVVGILLGIIIRRPRWLLTAVVCGVGFVIVPHLFILITLGVHPWMFFGFKMAAFTFLWNLAAIPLLLLGAWLGSRRGGQERGKERKPDDTININP